MSLLSKVGPFFIMMISMVVMPNAGAIDLSKVDLKNGERIFKEGKSLTGADVTPGPETAAQEQVHAQARIEVPPCTTCHGDKGEGNDALGTPRLSGQIYQFLVKQLMDFGTCKDPNDTATCLRQDTTMFVMNNNAMGLTPQERIDVAAYLSQLDIHYEPSNLDELAASGTEVGQAYRGKALVNYGNHNKGTPACRSCHDYNGRGVDPMFPMIGQQKYVYLVSQLKKWRDGSRHNDPKEAMQIVARKLSDAEIHDVAAFLAGPEGVSLSMGEFGTPGRHVPFKH